MMPKMNRQSAGIASASSTAAAACRSLATARKRPISPFKIRDRIIGMSLLDPHDRLRRQRRRRAEDRIRHHRRIGVRSEEHTSELQSRRDLVCRLLLEKKNESVLY